MLISPSRLEASSVLYYFGVIVATELVMIIIREWCASAVIAIYTLRLLLIHVFGTHVWPHRGNQVVRYLIYLFKGHGEMYFLRMGELCS